MPRGPPGNQPYASYPPNHYQPGNRMRGRAPPSQQQQVIWVPAGSNPFVVQQGYPMAVHANSSYVMGLVDAQFPAPVFTDGQAMDTYNMVHIPRNMQPYSLQQPHLTRGPSGSMGPRSMLSVSMLQDCPLCDVILPGDLPPNVNVIHVD